MPLATYAHKFAHLSTDKSDWDNKTNFRAPHKPLLLLSIMDLFAEGTLTTNFIELTPELGELFTLYWSKVTPMDRQRGNIAMPFWHLKSDGFWHLLPRPGYELLVQTASHVHSVKKLKEIMFGAKLDDALFALFLATESRELLRVILIETYFAPTLHPILQAQGAINVQAFHYSQELLTQAKDTQPAPQLSEDKPFRDQGFRRAIVKAYDHRCAICGVRILTADGHTAVAAAHIIPWSESHNDDPRNGLALCHLCHWTFDEGLVTFNDRYQVKTSPQLTTTPNLPGHLSTFTARTLIGPADNDLWPFVESIKWHRRHIFRHR